MTLASLVSFERRDRDADVLIVTNGWPHEHDEAYCIFVKRQVDELRARGLRCDVMFIRGFKSFAAYAVAAVRLLCMSFGRPRYRLVHAHSGEAALAASFYLRAPVIVSYLGDDVLGRPAADGSVRLRSRTKRALIRQHARLLAGAITKTAEMASALPAPVRRRTAIIPNGVNASLFHPRPRAEGRQLLGWDDSPVALFVANLSSPAQAARKRPWLAQEAVAIARGTVPNLRLETATGIAPDEIGLLMSAADCLVLASSVEGSPNVVKEALMCNLPVVATDVGDVRELLHGVEPSALVEATSDAIAAGIVSCLRHAGRSNGRERAARLDSDRVADRVMSVYRAYGVDCGTRTGGARPRRGSASSVWGDCG